MALPGSLLALRSYISLVAAAVLSCSLYQEVLEASTNNASIKPLVKRLAEQRKMALVIMAAILAYNVHDGRVGATRLMVALILLTLNISSIYDGVSNETFRACITTLGPITFTIINSLPPMIARVVLWIELFRGCDSKVAGAGVALLVSMPELLQIAGNVVAKWRPPNPVGAGDTAVDVSVEADDV